MSKAKKLAGWQAPIEELKLTERRQEALKNMKVETVEQLLQLYPFRYERVEAIPYDQWEPKMTVCFEGVIASSPSIIRLPNNRSMTKFMVLSWGERIQVTIFNRPYPSAFPFGKNITVFGTYQSDNKVTATNYTMKPIAEQTGLKPLWHQGKELKSNDMKAILEKALKKSEHLPDLIPADFKEKYRLLSRHQAFKQIHFPQDDDELHQALRTLKYEEFLLWQLSLQSAEKEKNGKPARLFDENLVWQKADELPYTLTDGQKKALSDILSDMHADESITRLVQGDVGCGKTSVADLAIYAELLSGHQAALLAPTEILCRQHLAKLKELDIDAELYCSSLKASEKKRVLERLDNGDIFAVVGTHALFEDHVRFDSLGLVIADEQQRFGVKQRRSLIKKGEGTDVVMMSATPIPRTYARFLYGDIALSPIYDKPPGRKPVLTKTVRSGTMKPVLKEVLQGLDEGAQLYVICPAIEDNEEMPIHAAQSIYEGMEKTFKGRYSVALLHGRMDAVAKQQVMEDFASGKTRILVSTTVVEVGVDVPNATMMVIYDANRFGLSALHQLRGRAARGPRQGKCFLMTTTKDPEALGRLKALEQMEDGFALSKYDLQTRGPGDVLGTRQSGLPEFILGDFAKDPVLMDICMKDAATILKRKSEADRPILKQVRRLEEAGRYAD